MRIKDDHNCQPTLQSIALLLYHNECKLDIMYSNNRVKLVPWIKDKFYEIHCHNI
jgi:hypothetical protein